jgi:hypothetical protein
LDIDADNVITYEEFVDALSVGQECPKPMHIDPTNTIR